MKRYVSEVILLRNRSYIFKLISGLITLIGLVSSIITIALGYDMFFKLIDKLFTLINNSF